jgi:hypothetical protein
MITELKGVLEIDHDRGVIYFSLSDEKDINKRRVVTALRICNLPTPIPQVDSRGLDITHMINADWEGTQRLPPDEVLVRKTIRKKEMT